MTWLEIKQAVEAKGVKDNDNIRCVELDNGLSDICQDGLEVDKDEKTGELEIWN